MRTGSPARRPIGTFPGETLPGAYKYALNTGVDFRAPAFAGLDFVTSFNAAYTSSFKSDNALSDFSVIPAKTIADLAIGAEPAESVVQRDGAGEERVQRQHAADPVVEQLLAGVPAVVGGSGDGRL